jgi:serine/threonine protein kinase
MLQVLNHEQIVKLEEIYQGKNSVYLITELLQGDTLYHFIMSYPAEVIPDNVIRIIMIVRSLIKLYF